MIRVLHFADAHIDMAAQGKHDPLSGLPYRVLDFLAALDTIVNQAIDEKVDLVIFAGDAYKDRTPVPTFQREWGKRMSRLSQAGIQTVLVVGNHDLSPAVGRAHALQEFQTLQVPNITVIDRPCLLTPEHLGGVPVQIIGLPWISRSGIIASLDMSGIQIAQVYEEMETRMKALVDGWLDKTDSDLPVILTAHASVAGAEYGFERSVNLGSDLALPASLVRDPRLDYVALGHIHRAQDVNKGEYPPAVYPGSIERVDINEVNDTKYYVIAKVEKNRTEIEWRKLEGRRFFDRHVSLERTEKDIFQRLVEALPSTDEMKDAFVRLVIDYPRDLDPMIDEFEIRKYASETFDFQLMRRPRLEIRGRISDQQIGSMAPLDLLDLYWTNASTTMDQAEIDELNKLAGTIIHDQVPDDSPAKELF